MIRLETITIIIIARLLMQKFEQVFSGGKMKLMHIATLVVCVGVSMRARANVFAHAGACMYFCLIVSV